jgi:TetR/AcrR family transcriptional regulator, tetracycline repressor protein
MRLDLRHSHNASSSCLFINDNLLANQESRRGEVVVSEPKRAVGRPRKEDAFLDPDVIVEAAWALVERDGVDALTTRTLAAALGVQSPALYWHVPKMTALHSLMVERMLTESVRNPVAGEDWHDWLHDVGMAQRRNFLSHRDSGRILAMAPPTTVTRNQIMPMLIAPLVEAGFSPEDAVASAGAFASYILGWVIYEQSTETKRYIGSMVNLVTAFEFGLAALIAGLQQRLRDEAGGASDG